MGHEGPITRIASGCGENDRARLGRLFDAKAASGGWKDAFVHFTPLFSKDAKTGNDYKFYNKPFGMLHWLRHGDHGGGAQREMVPPVAALIDPDEMFLRPLTTALGNASNLLVSPPVKVEELLRPTAAAPSSASGQGESSPQSSQHTSQQSSPLGWRVVGRGFPAAQFYGIGDHWLTFNRSHVCGAASPCATASSGHAWRYYTVGPPYILHHSDWLVLAPSWADFVPRVYEEYPELLAEMYAYAMAAAHHDLRHARVDHLMVRWPPAAHACSTMMM